jgi:hypothetical protein
VYLNMCWMLRWAKISLQGARVVPLLGQGIAACVLEHVQVAGPIGPEISEKCWSERQDLNLRPPRPERGALPG